MNAPVNAPEQMSPIGQGRERVLQAICRCEDFFTTLEKNLATVISEQPSSPAEQTKVRCGSSEVAQFLGGCEDRISRLGQALAHLNDRLEL